MKLYHYVPYHHTVKENGLLAVVYLPDELAKYGVRAQTKNPEGIIGWLEKTFIGRSRAISVLTEPIQGRHNHPMLKDWADKKVLVEIDFDRLLADNLVQSVWCKVGSDPKGEKEQFYQIRPDEIEKTPLAWEKCSPENGFFGVVRHYFLVMKEGVIPPAYLKLKEINHECNHQ